MPAAEALELPPTELQRIPELFVPIKLCVPEGKKTQYPACAAASRLDWYAMPDTTTMDDMLHLAYAMDDGYRVSALLGFGHPGDLAKARAAQHQQTGRYHGLASELWCCLFFKARAWHWTDWPGRAPDEGKEDWDALYRALVERLKWSDGSVEAGPGEMTRWLGYGRSAMTDGEFART